MRPTSIVLNFKTTETLHAGQGTRKHRIGTQGERNGRIGQGSQMAKKAKPAEVPREGVNTRITKDLREKLDAAAVAAGRSTGSEIERRLERSFRFRDELLDVLADPRTLNAAVVIAMTWMDFEQNTGLPWYKNRDTMLAAQSSAMAVLSNWRCDDGETIQNPADTANIREERDKVARMLGIAHADRIRHRVMKTDVPDEIHAVISALGADLFDKKSDDGEAS